MSPTAKVALPARDRAAPSLCEPDKARRHIDADDVGAAERERDGEGAGAAARVEDARATKILGKPGAIVSRMASRPARTVARMRLTGASDVSRVHALTAVRSK